jgi:hypothetical protein
MKIKIVTLQSLGCDQLQKIYYGNEYVPQVIVLVELPT